ncbi:hypothetical protein R3W88_012798 [Solanum pinnatisectum]|uniref:Oligopeptide transporter n=1 Tax=Solanum pinnatisectum TaxID=50273 RepID=A0AAV9LCN2_9SOLN|nr:hypothetical protein R3W88_012798 [Solanum pinnatisectum]
MVVNMQIKDPENVVPEEEDVESPIEQVRLTVSNDDDPSLPVWTFRMWFLGRLLSCALLSFLNTFFSYRAEPLVISMITVQVATLPIGRLMARVLPKRNFTIKSWEFSLNPGPFKVKEHVLISIFANAGSAFGNGPAYAVGIVDIIKPFYFRNITFLAGWILVVATQVLGYGWAGIMRMYVVDPAEMWWPSSLVQVSLFRALHDKEGEGKTSRGKFFLVVLACSFIWYIVPGFLFPTLSNLSLLCLAYPKSVVDPATWFRHEGPLVYIPIPASYWGLNLYNAKKFPLFSSELFDARGQIYNVTEIVNDKFEIDKVSYAQRGRIHLSMFFAVTYGLNFAAVMLLSLKLLHSMETSYKGKPDIHTRLVMKYKDIPNWWFYLMLAPSLALSLVLCIFMKDQVQLSWWGLLLAACLALIYTLPISVITATTNMSPGLNVITKYVIGMIIPGKPIANVCFKTFAYMSMSQAVSFLQDFKRGHYMKVPPRSMFIVQLVGTILGGTINMGIAWWLPNSIDHICQPNLLPPNSPWTFIWGLVGPRRIFLGIGEYSALNWCFIGGLVAPFLVWLLHKSFPSQSWIKLINIPVLLAATASMPPATTLNFNSWIIIGTVYNFFVFRYRKQWWQRYNYVLSAALDAGVANVNFSWWGTGGEYCDLASCPTGKGIFVDGCPLT